MKIKVQTEFEVELPKELWWMYDVDWGDEGITLALLSPKGGPVIAMSVKGTKGINLKTVCKGYRILGIVRDQDA